MKWSSSSNNRSGEGDQSRPSLYDIGRLDLLKEWLVERSSVFGTSLPCFDKVCVLRKCQWVGNYWLHGPHRGEKAEGG